MVRGDVPADVLSDAGLTRSVVALLLVVYVVEVIVWQLFGLAGVAYAFLATPEPTPGWVLAPFAHSVLDPLHLVTSLVVVGVYGALVEARLPAAAYLSLYVVAGYVSTAVQVASYVVTPGPGTMGASGAAMALVAYIVVATALRRALGRPTTLGERVFATTGVAIVALRVARDLGVVVPAVEGTAPVGHATGILVGTAYGVWRAVPAAPANFLASRRDR